jgi:hypothetical protein
MRRQMLGTERVWWRFCSRLRSKCDGTSPETRFRLSAKRASPFKSAGASVVDCWQASCAHQPAGFVLLVQACVLQSCDAYWLPTPFSCSPFTSPTLASPSVITFQLDSTYYRSTERAATTLNGREFDSLAFTQTGYT